VQFENTRCQENCTQWKDSAAYSAKLVSHVCNVIMKSFCKTLYKMGPRFNESEIARLCQQYLSVYNLTAFAGATLYSLFAKDG
jgi:hypothetical protein